MRPDGSGREILARHGALGSVLDELLEYAENRFPRQGFEASRFPLADEPHVEDWERYVEEARCAGAAKVLTQKLVQLRFPIAAGMSSDAAYLASTRRGAPTPDGQAGISFVRPEGMRIFLHRTAAGRVPIVVAEDRSDFVALVRALTCRNEPTPVPAAQGACVVGGYNNWDRIARYRQAWEARGGSGKARDWDSEFRRLVPQKQRYQDRFILLSQGPYSGVPASRLGLTDEVWRTLSLAIRLEHECAHYFTRRVLGSMSNTLHDELIADYVGITLASGEYRPEWLLHFMGLEDHPDYRTSGRLGSYRGDPPLSEPAFRILQSLVVSAAQALSTLDPLGRARDYDLTNVAAAIGDLAALPLLAMASAGDAAVEAR